MIFDNKQLKVPYDSYVSVNNQIFNADVYIKITDDELDNFSYPNCVVILFIVGRNNERKYFQYLFFDKFTNEEFDSIDLKGYSPQGLYIFFKDSKFLEDFKTTNKFII